MFATRSTVWAVTFVLGAASLSLVACKGETGGGTPDGDAANQTNPPTGGGGMDIGSLGNAAGQAFDDLKKQFSGAVTDAESKVAALKTKADTLKDEQLNTLMASINAKLAEVKAAVKSMVDSGSDASKSSVEKLMGELNALVDQGTKRANELSAG